MTTSHQRIANPAGQFASGSCQHANSTAALRARCFLLVLGLTGCTDPMSAFAPGKPAVQVATLSITPAEVHSLALRQVVAFHVVARDESGATLPYASVVWTASDPEVAQIRPTTAYSGSAAIEALQPGTTTLTAKSGSARASVTIVVHPPGPVATVVILSQSEVAVGKTAQLRVVQRDSEGVELTTPMPTFSSSDSSIARVSVAGLVTALAEGTAVVVATSAGKSALQQLTVRASEHGFMWTAVGGMIDLGTLPGFVSSKARAVSSAGHVAGSMSTAAELLSHAFVRAPGAGAELRDLGGLPAGGSSEAFGVNSAGQVVGYATTATGVKHAVLWQPNGALVDLGTRGGDASVALSINDGGQVVGWTGTGAHIQPFIWTVTSGMQMLDSVTDGIAFALNASGKVAGESYTRPIVWSAVSSASLLPLLPGNDVGRAHAISDAGEMVGYSSGCDDAYYTRYYYDDCDGLEHPVMWAANNVSTDLHSIASATTIASVSGINSAHQVVGSNDNRRAILWSAASGVRDLGVLHGRLWSAATAINDAGVVVGVSFNP